MNARPFARKRLIAVVSAALVLIVVGVGFALTSREDKDAGKLASSASTTSPPISEITSTSSTEGGTSSSSATTQTTAGTCTNSFDSKCGPQIWKPTAGSDGPITAKLVKQTPADPKKDDPVTITVRVDDADATMDKFWISDYQPTRGDFTGGTVFAHYSSGCAKRTTPYGTWTTPAKKSGSYEMSYDTMADYAGFPTYTIVEAASDLCSFVRYENGKRADTQKLANFQPYYNPYADWKVWSVCVDKTYHFSIAGQGKCPEGSLRG